jgi:hypothetical protein
MGQRPPYDLKAPGGRDPGIDPETGDRWLRRAALAASTTEVIAERR